MARLNQLINRRQNQKQRKEAGIVTMAEAMVATVATSLVIGASAVGLRTTETLISGQLDKATFPGIGLKVKKANKEGDAWTEKVQKKFTELVQSLE